MFKSQKMLNGMRIVVRDPIQCTKNKSFFKRHRKKKQWAPRVKVFAGFYEVLKDGEIISDPINNVIHMNRKTYDQFKQYVEVGGE